jgi:hypothetical protein
MKTSFFLLLITLNFNAFGKIYKWVDENGSTHYSEKKPEDTEHKEIKIGKEEKTPSQITPSDIAGQWLVDEGLFLPSSEGITVIWEFNKGTWTVIKSGKRLPSYQYQLIGNSLDMFEMSIEILSVSKNALKASVAGQEFVMKRK